MPFIARIARIGTRVKLRILPRPSFVDYLIVGGGGGYFNGGAGGYLRGDSYPIQTEVQYTVQVGSGGVGPAVFGSPGSGSGGPSMAYLTSNPGVRIGGEAFGGGGGNGTDGGTGGAGGSGGGNFGYPTCNFSGGTSPPACIGGAGTPGQGYPGGDGFRGPNVNGYYPRNGGGGGGAGGRGQQGSWDVDGAGGPGVYNNITGSNVLYAAGAPSPAGASVGGGGGYPGAVIFRYPTEYKQATATGTYTESPYANYRVYNFTGPGTITF